MTAHALIGRHLCIDSIHLILSRLDSSVTADTAAAILRTSIRRKASALRVGDVLDTLRKNILTQLGLCGALTHTSIGDRVACLKCVLTLR